jgi:peroxiredoxin
MNSTIVWTIAIAVLVAAGAVFVRKKLPFGPTIPDKLRKGEQLPDFSAIHEGGDTVRSSELRGQPTVILFVRGNWCPFCTRQVEEVTTHYKDLTALGARLIFITPKPLDTTRRVAEFFNLEFEFWLDESLAIATSLGLVMSDGVAEDWSREYGNDTFWPTALVVDKDGIIRYSKLSRLIFNRPNSEVLVKELRKL